MPGARFQNTARVRNSYPWSVNYGQRINMAVVSVAADNEVPLLYPTTVRMPFDAGPDRGSLVGIVVHDIKVICRANVYTPTAPIISGIFYFRGIDGNKVYLPPIHETLVNIGTVVETDTIITLPAYVAQENQLNIGNYGFENLATAFGSAATLTLVSYLNIGLYPIYGETDIEKNIVQAIREIQTPQWVKETHSIVE